MSPPCKCVIWDLDNTVWDGVSLEETVRPRPEIRTAIATLQQRGILHSIASRGERDVAWRMLEDHHLSDYFLVPKINWLPKTTNILDIARELNISLDAVAFIDDDPYEREQAAFMLPGVRVFAAEAAAALPDLPDFSPAVLTMEARMRSRLYEEEMARNAAQRHYASRDEFLRSCGLELTVRRMTRADIPRALELMTRTHQLNTTGILLEENELERILTLPAYMRAVHVAQMRDRFGRYGTVGIALTEEREAGWTLQLFSLSCRVMGRGIERTFLSVLVEDARKRGNSRIRALYRETGKNRMMRAMYQMSGFRKYECLPDGSLAFRLQDGHTPTVPHWVRVI